MLFNSPEFLFAFLPLVLAGYTMALRGSRGLAIWIALLASLFFYGWWDPKVLPLLVGSILGNYGLAYWMSRAHGTRRHALLAIGVAANLGLLGYYKYTNFLVATLNDALAVGLDPTAIVLPIGISFYTFQQIAFLVDTHRAETVERVFSRYALFIAFFPQLIAGPIVHHRELMPQFGRERDDFHKPLLS